MNLPEVKVDVRDPGLVKTIPRGEASPSSQTCLPDVQGEQFLGQESGAPSSTPGHEGIEESSPVSVAGLHKNAQRLLPPRFIEPVSPIVTEAGSPRHPNKDLESPVNLEEFSDDHVERRDSGDSTTTAGSGSSGDGNADSESLLPADKKAQQHPTETPQGRETQFRNSELRQKLAQARCLLPNGTANFKNEEDFSRTRRGSLSSDILPQRHPNSAPATVNPVPVKRRPGRPLGSTKKMIVNREYQPRESETDFSLRQFYEAGGRGFEEYVSWANRNKPQR